MSDTQPTAAQPDRPDEPTQHAEAAGEPPAAPPAAPTAAPTGGRTRLRDLVFGLKSLVAVAVAGVIMGGLAGFGIHAATDGEGRDGRMGRFGPGRAGFPGGPEGGFGGPGQMGPGQMGPGQVGPGGQLPPQGGTQQQPSQVPSQDS